MTVPVSLRHTAVVHHEEVDLQLVGAGPPDVVVLRPDEVNHLDTATLAWGGGGHRVLKLTAQFTKLVNRTLIVELSLSEESKCEVSAAMCIKTISI